MEKAQDYMQNFTVLTTIEVQYKQLYTNCISVSLIEDLISKTQTCIMSATQNIEGFHYAGLITS